VRLPHSITHLFSRGGPNNVGCFSLTFRGISRSLSPSDHGTTIPFAFKMTIAADKLIFSNNLSHQSKTSLSYPKSGNRLRKSGQNALNRSTAQCIHRAIVWRLGVNCLSMARTSSPLRTAFKQFSCVFQGYQRLGAIHSGRTEQVRPQLGLGQ